jgi:S-adenosylmethionine hydrolase
VCGQRIEGVADSYAAVPPRSLLAIFGSRGYLEIALNQASAADQLDAGRGTEVEIATHVPKLTLYTG